MLKQLQLERDSKQRQNLQENMGRETNMEQHKLNRWERKRNMANKEEKMLQSKERKKPSLLRKNSINSGKPNFSRVTQIHSGVSERVTDQDAGFCSSNLQNILHHVQTLIKQCIEEYV